MVRAGRSDRPWFRHGGRPRRQRCRSGRPRRTSRGGASRSESSPGAPPLSRSDALPPQPAARILGRRAAPERGPMSKTRWCRLRPAGSPEAALSARACRRLPRASASLGQSAAWAALAGQIGPGFYMGENPTEPQPQPLQRRVGERRAHRVGRSERRPEDTVPSCDHLGLLVGLGAYHARAEQAGASAAGAPGAR